MVTLGIRMIGRKARAFRSDRCRACEGQVVAVRQRRWIWLSLFMFIPLVPLGFRNVWICRDCDEPTGARPRTSLIAKLAWLAFSLMIIAVGVNESMAPADPHGIRDNPPPAVFFALGGAASAYCLWKVATHKRISTRAQVLEGFEPAVFDACPLCRSALEEEAAIAVWSVRRCSGCGLADEPLNLAG